MRSSAPTRCRRSRGLLAAHARHGSGLALRRRRSRPRRGIRRRAGARRRQAAPSPSSTGGLPTAHALAAADNAAGALTVKVLRATTGGTEDGVVRALDLKGLPLGEAPLRLQGRRARDRRRARPAGRDPQRHRAARDRRRALGRRRAAARQALAPPHRRRRLRLDRRHRAAAARLDLSISSRALNPFADVRLADVAAPAEAVRRFIEQNVPMIILADVGNVSGEARDRLVAWIEDGGVLVRFAGPRLAASDDDLVPVKLRRGGRTLGGSLSWEQPQPLAAFSREGPFAGMPVPNDVTVTRQVLAEPDAGLAERTWATLADGTPLVTAAQARQGHDRAVPRHRRHALVGPAAVRHLRRDAPAHRRPRRHDRRPTTTAKPQREREVVPPTRILDGFGAFGPPPPTARPVPVGLRRRAPPPIIRPASTARRKACSRSIRWRPPTGWRRSTSRRCTRGSRPIRSASRRICAGRCCSRRSRCCARRAGGVLARRRHCAASCRAAARDRGAAAAGVVAARCCRFARVRAAPRTARRAASPPAAAQTPIRPRLTTSP